MSEVFELAPFEPRLNETFYVDYQGETVPLVLITAELLKRGSPVRERAFHLRFRSNKLLPQGHYEFNNDALGAIAFGITPTGYTEPSYFYQALFC